MNETEIAEIRRRFRLEKNNITHVRGCYVNEKKEIISQFDQLLNLMPQAEAENLLAILRKTLSGAIGKNLIDIAFDTEQVVDSREHRLLMSLKNTQICDDDVVEAIYKCVIESLNLEEGYLILLTHDQYDVPYRAKDGVKQDDASSEVFSYILCSICPIKVTKPSLGYHVYDNKFHNCHPDWLVSAPELGFMFPAFDERSANIYNCLYYSRNVAENHKELAEAVFHREIPMPAAAQKETFEAIIEDSLAEDCSYEVVQTVHGKLREMIVAHKANKEPEPLAVSTKAVKEILKSCGVSEEHMTVFEEKYDEEFGQGVDLSPQNIVDAKQLEVRTPDVTIRVNPNRGDLVEMRIIDDTQYILIRANEGVEVNGVEVHNKSINQAL